MRTSAFIAVLVAPMLLAPLFASSALAQQANEPKSAQADFRQGEEGSLTPAPQLEHMARYARYRASWYVGFGVGGGLGDVTDKRGYDSTLSGGPAFSLRLGLVPLPWLLIGVEGSHWSGPVSGGWQQLYHTDAILTLYPIYDVGLYGKFGFGGGVAVLRPGDTKKRSDIGFDLKAGLGYELQVGRRLAIGLDLSFARTGYSGGSVHDMCANLTFIWF